jgi:hypothetical protein
LVSFRRRYPIQDDANWLAVCPDTLFLDIKDAAEAARIPEQITRELPHITRGKTTPKSEFWRSMNMLRSVRWTRPA